HVRFCLRLDRGDFGWRQGAGTKEVVQLGERIACLLLSQTLLALVCLGVLGRVAAQARHGEPQQSRALARSHVRDGLLEQSSCLHRLGPITARDLKVAEAGEIGRDVPTRRLEAGWYRDAVAVVLYVEEQGQREGRCYC